MNEVIEYLRSTRHDFTFNGYSLCINENAIIKKNFVLNVPLNISGYGIIRCECHKPINVRSTLFITEMSLLPSSFVGGVLVIYDNIAISDIKVNGYVMQKGFLS